MLTSIYQGVLRLYPSKYRQIFASEMLETFQQASQENEKRGLFSSITFAIAELAGALIGAAGEWVAKWTRRDRYIARLASPIADTDVLPDNVRELQRLLQKTIRCMEVAISHHDFPRARFYSYAERATRTKLQRLTGETRP